MDRQKTDRHTHPIDTISQCIFYLFFNFIACPGKHKCLEDLPLAHQKPITQNTKRRATEA